MPDKTSLPIAIFDSGVGGLTVLQAISALLPAEDLLYLGDTARVPYGTKSREAIARYTLEAANALLSRGAKMLVIGCNTATSAALYRVRDRFAPTPVLGVIEPGAASAVAACRNGFIAVIATEATIREHAYHEAIAKIAPHIHVAGRACTLFVPLAEEGWVSGPIVEETARRYLADIFDEKPDMPDTLLLGCTHFPLMRETLQLVVGPSVRIVDSASATALCVREELERLGLLRETSHTGANHFLTTDNPERFARSGTLFLRHRIGSGDVELIDL